LNVAQAFAVDLAEEKLVCFTRKKTHAPTLGATTHFR